MNKNIFISLIVSILLIGGAFFLVSSNPCTPSESATSTVVSMIDGIQFIDISAKGGYSPRKVIAKADIPTVLRVETSGTFDCSASLVIPKLSYQKFLKPSGTEDISIPGEKAQGTMQGL